MPRIPTVVSEVDIRTGRTNAGVPSPNASAEAFGAPMARAMGALGGGLQDLGKGLHDLKERRREEDVANRVATSDFTRRELELRTEAPADGAGYQDRVLEEYDAFVDEQAALIEDDETRAEYRRRMEAQRPNVSSRAASYEFGIAAEHSSDETNTALAGLDNRIRLQPDQYDTLLQQGLDVINASTAIPATAKEAAVTGWTNKAALTYFEGRLESADDAFDVDAVIEDLQSGDWSDKLSSEGMSRLLSGAKTARTAIQTKADADARAAVEFLEGRATDVTMLLPEEELAAAQELVAKSGNPITQSRMARIARDQEILRDTRKLPVSAQGELIDATKEGGTVAGLPQLVVSSINDAAASYGVSPTYLAGMVGREYGGQLKPDADGNIDYGKGNAAGASSAVGVGQIVSGTMLALAKDPSNVAVVKSVTGIDMAGMSDAEILELRKDPTVSILLSAAYAAQNAGIIKSVTGRDPTDGELYIAHFLGGGGAATLLKAIAADPNQSAAALLPASAKANGSEFYKPNGDAYTVQELYSRLGSRFGGGTTYVAFGDVQTREDIMKQTETALNDNPMGHSEGVGLLMLSDIMTPEGMAARGKDARMVADYYGISMDNMKPFQPDEAAALAKQIKDGDADQALAVLAQVQMLGGAVARAGMKQLGQETNTYGFAGALQLETGRADVASDIVRGQKRIDENPSIMKDIGASDTDLSSAFLAATGTALYDIAPNARQSIQDAAIAHYVETVVSRGGSGTFDAEAFAGSIDAVLGGGTGGTAAVDEVNGSKTTLPPGVTGALVEEAFSVMEVQDWVAMSESRTPPRYADGKIADPDSLQYEASLRAIGGGRYKVAMDDGSYLVTGNGTTPGRMEAFIFVPTKERLESVVNRAGAAAAAKAAEKATRPTRPSTEAQRADIAAAQQDGNLTADEIAALTAKYGDMWAYDADGVRVTP